MKTDFKVLKLNIAAAIAYFILGQAGLLLAVPPINATAVWPAAGIALAAVLVAGKKIIPGLLIAGFIVQSISFFDYSSTEKLFSTLLISSTISVAAVMQAWVGATLIQLYIKNDDALLRERSVLLFFLFAGPVSCTISASVSIIILWFEGILVASDIPLSWMTWWIGDSIGAIVVSPIVLCFFSKPRYFWKQRILSVAIPLCVLICVTFIAFRFSYKSEVQFIENEFEKNTRYFIDNLKNSIYSNIEATYELKEYFDNSKGVTEDEFKNYAKPKLHRHPEIEALEWIPKVLHKDRKMFEDRIGTNIKMLNENGVIEVSTAKEFYYPVHYLAPYDRNENALGFDIRTNPIALETTDTACATGKLAVTDAIKLIQEKGNRKGIVFYAPIYEKKFQDKINNDCRYLAGFVASVFRLEEQILKIFDEMSYLKLFILLKDGEDTIFSNYPDVIKTHSVPNNINFTKVHSFPIANQYWQLTFYPESGFFAYYSSWTIWIVLISGLFITGLSGMGLLMLTGRTLLTDEKVKERTRDLNEEVKEREQVVQLLEIENKCLELITKDFSINDVLDSINTGIEKLIPGALSSILLLDKEGKYFCDVSGASLPKEFMDAIHGVQIGPKVGSCGTAVYFNKQVIVSDIEHDELWADYKNLVLKHGIRACWSTPITIENGKIIGTFAIYFHTIKEADEKIIELINRVSNIVSVSILRKQAEEQLAFNANHDALTGLVNRHEFERRADQLLSTVKTGGVEHALCFMDLDQFKVVNDSCGHIAGDELLRQLTSVLMNVIRKRDTLARLGGDEFGALIENCSLEDAHRVASSLQKAIQDYLFVWENQPFKIGVSIGLVPITADTSSTTQLLSDADAACYIAKDSGRNRIHVYHTEDSEIAIRHGEMQWVSRINRAFQEDKFCLFAQTIESLDGGKNSHEHYELLIRMLDEDDNVIPPGAFLPAAERYNLISKIDYWVIANTFNTLVKNPVFLERIDFCSINLSGQSVTEPDMLNYIIDQLNRTQIDGYKICFEITETAAISNLNKATEFITTLKELGCRFALDDFGSGLSSFGYLKNLPVDYLKIDGMFVKDIVDDPIDHAMVKSINEVGGVMGMRTIAEFVENDIIKGMLKEIGVNYAQGYGIGKPQPLKNLLDNATDKIKE